MADGKENQHLTKWIAVGLVAGIVIGLLTRWIPMADSLRHVLVDQIYFLIGQLFFRLIIMMVVPIVFISLLCGCQSLRGSSLGQIGGRSLLFYLLTTAVAIALALAVADIFSIGYGAGLGGTGSQVLNEQSQTWVQMILNMVPENPFAALNHGQMLAIIVFSLLLGMAIGAVSDKAPVLMQVIDQTQTALIRLMRGVMAVAPVGVAALLARTFADIGFSVIGHLLGYFLVVVLVLVLQATFVYSGFLYFIARLSPLTFFKKMRSAMMFAFSVSSSAASIPVVLRSVTKKLGVNSRVASFVIPLGATINMDGTAIMQGVATVFIAHAYGFHLTIAHYLLVIAMATMASIGTAAVPSVGLITLTMVLKQVGLPVEGIALILGVDRLLDMLRTAVNVSGDAMIATIVGRQTGQLNLDTYNAKGEIDGY